MSFNRILETNIHTVYVWYVKLKKIEKETNILEIIIKNRSCRAQIDDMVNLISRFYRKGKFKTLLIQMYFFMKM